MAATIPPEQIDRVLSGKEATQLILRLVEDRAKARETTGRFPRPWRVVEHTASFYRPGRNGAKRGLVPF
jgi:hypothetical protein